MIVHSDGLSTDGLIKALKNMAVKPVYISSDEEQNTLFKGFYIDEYDDCVIIAGLAGCEVED